MVTYMVNVVYSSVGNTPGDKAWVGVKSTVPLVTFFFNFLNVPYL